MRGFRITILLLVFCSAAVALAGIRIEQARCTARIQDLRLQRLTLKQTLHEQQLQAARLRSPAQIHDRIERLQLRVVAPEAPQHHMNTIRHNMYVYLTHREFEMQEQ